MNPYVIEQIIREKRELLLQEAKRKRLIAEYEITLPSRRQRFFTIIGHLFTSIKCQITGLRESGKPGKTSARYHCRL